MRPDIYDAWYHTERGSWIGATESRLMLELLNASPGASVLDVGSGTGYFSRRLAAAGRSVVAVDADHAALRFARQRDRQIPCVLGDAQRLPFADRSVDYCTAVTSLCFVSEPAVALAEMWRVVRCGMFLGLLNRWSLLHHRKRGRGGYRGARWDDLAHVREWAARLDPAPRLVWASGVFVPGASPFARWLERVIPRGLPWGAFLAVALHKPDLGRAGPCRGA
ncbi:MAG: hypothetical protein B7Z66_00045 [Chromatiales bacterium 21-64-14]|nr:MAG: hypothetical protein B7Z66_00045 [Chromatiales bacterium 21-64-14]HQU16251.1 class I SAM-dependent methyltransferase [Gammaproteobacteria bacterium]